MNNDMTNFPAVIADRMKELDDAFADLERQVESLRRQQGDIIKEREIINVTMAKLLDAGWEPPPIVYASPPHLLPGSSLFPDSSAQRVGFLRNDIVDLIRRGVRNEDEIFRQLMKRRSVNRRQRESALKYLFTYDIIRRDASGELHLTDEPSAASETPSTVAEPAPEPAAVESAPHPESVPQPVAVASESQPGQVRDKILWLFDHQASKTGMYTTDTMKKALARLHVTASAAAVQEAFGELQDNNLIKEGHAPGWWMRVRDEQGAGVRKGPR